MLLSHSTIGEKVEGLRCLPGYRMTSARMSSAACPETATACPERGQTVSESSDTIVINDTITLSDKII